MDNNIEKNAPVGAPVQGQISSFGAGAPKAPFQPNAAPQATAKKKKRRTAEKRDIVYAVMTAIFSLAAVDFIFWSKSGIGVALVAVLSFFTTSAYIAEKRRFSLYSVTVSVVYALLCASLVFSDYSFSKVLTVLLLAVLYAVNIAELSDTRYYRGGSFFSVADFFITALITPFDGIGGSMWALFHKNDGEGKPARRKIGAVLIGIAFAVPVLGIVLPLLVSSDAAFEGLIEKLTFNKIGEIVGVLILGTALFVYLFSQSFTSREIKVQKKDTKINGCVDPVIISTFLGAVSLAYVLYLFSQLAYFFDAFSGILRDGYTMAEYARRGFFEMSAICVINLVIVFVTTILAKKKDDRIPTAVKLIASFICLFSVLLVATAVSKMVMYINSYGMTHLRILTSLFMVFLAVVFAAVILRLFIKKIPYMQIALLAGAVVVCVMTFADIDRVVAGYNISAYLDGRLKAVDMQTIEMLDSDAVVPYVLRLCECDDEAVSDQAKRLLATRFFPVYYKAAKNSKTGEWEVVDTLTYDVRGFNIPSYNAKRLLLENFDKFADGFDMTR